MSTDQATAPADGNATDKAAWQRIVAKYAHASNARALWQVANTFVPYLLLWGLMYLSLGVSWWITLPLALLAGGFLVRIFIIFHDCCHDSFFASRRANQLLGYVAGILTFTSFEDWRRSHARHHATAGDLDRRGEGISGP